ncbi:hypothetical protein [Mycolicibacterium sp. 120270]|uniref:hypothetical protein n=1 Tax=Mycolicibacterium sp. 120270 TaxID=3090600 RepID=UPI00299ED999|nr:hypothetical protein [Mycolicibacterium sp. 120270]MDX1883802.1 hypothetical protein [Mycolicibacterium sp. 120270]
MGRVNRLMERRALRRAADQALLTSLQTPVNQMSGAADRDFTYADADREPPQPVEPPAHDHDPDTAPIPVVQVEKAVLPHSTPPWEQQSAVVDIAEPAADLYDLVPEPPAAAPARRIAETTYVRPELDFVAANYREPQWYRKKPAAAAIAAAVIAAVVCGGWLVFRSPSTTAEESQTNPPTGASPTPSNTPPTPASAAKPKPKPPAPPPPPPPPPPSAGPTYSAPQRQYQPWYSEPTTAQKPRVDVTRAPMSVAPVPKPVPGSDSSTPGDAPGEKPRRRGCFGFC